MFNAGAAAAALFSAGVATAAPASAQAIPDWRTDPFLQLAERDESGARNIPNFKFDSNHTAGGGWQITTTNWLHYAPMVDIDIVKYPNALSAPEWLQGQVAGKMYAETGIMPWVPYNARLRRDLHTVGDIDVHKQLASPMPTGQMPTSIIAINPFVEPTNIMSDMVFRVPGSKP